MGASMVAYTTLKIAVVAPTPNANVSSATAVNPGLLRSRRKAKRKFWRSVCICFTPSLVPQRHHGIDLRRTESRKGGRRERERNNEHRHDAQRQRVVYRDTEHLVANCPPQNEAERKSDDES